MLSQCIDCITGVSEEHHSSNDAWCVKVAQLPPLVDNGDWMLLWSGWAGLAGPLWLDLTSKQDILAAVATSPPTKHGQIEPTGCRIEVIMVSDSES